VLTNINDGGICPTGVCQSGVCVDLCVQNNVTCTPTQCQSSVCNPQTGLCVTANINEGGACAGGVCQSGSCVCVEANPCTTNDTCCSGHICRQSTQVCQDCLAAQDFCSANAECCSGLVCRPAPFFGKACQTCLPTGAYQCAVDSDCCTGVCRFNNNPGEQGLQCMAS
jgi:hypothetical protein